MMESKNNSHRYCSVPQCFTKKKENISFHFFPKNKSLAEEWKQVLQIQKPISKYMNVCSLHFKRTDFFFPDVPAKRKNLNKNAIPSENLPKLPINKKSSQKQRSTIISNRRRKKTTRINRTTKLSSLSENNTNNEDLQDREAAEALLSFIKTPNVAHLENHHGIGTDQVITENDLKTLKHTPKFRTIAVQTESTNVSSTTNSIDNSQQVSFNRILNYLRKNLVDHVLKVDGTAFRINECTISFTNENQDVKKKEILVIQSDKVVSSCKYILDSLLEGERMQDYSKKTHSMKSLNFGENVCNNVKVLLHKLPECLAEASEKGHTLKITNEAIQKQCKEGNWYPNNLFKIEIIPDQVLPVKKSEYSDYENNYTNRNGNVLTHSDLDYPLKNGENISTTSKSCSENPEVVQNSLSVIEQEIKVKETGLHSDAFNKTIRTSKNLKYQQKSSNKKENSICSEHEETCPECSELLQNTRELENHLLENHRVVLKKDNYICDICSKQFLTYKSLIYHNRTTHNLDGSEDVVFKLKCGNCKKLFHFSYFKNVHLYECTTKLKEERKLKSELTDSETSTAILCKRTTMKRKSSRISSTNYKMEIKRPKIDNETEKSSIGKTSTDIFIRLEALMGMDEGPNKITIVNLDE